MAPVELDSRKIQATAECSELRRRVRSRNESREGEVGERKRRFLPIQRTGSEQTDVEIYLSNISTFSAASIFPSLRLS